MATFIMIEPDAFNEGFKQLSTGTRPGRAGFVNANTRGRFNHVRRPVRGIQIKENTYATLQVRTADGRNLPLFDAAGTVLDENDDSSAFGGGFTTHNSNFLIQSIQESRAEKQQVVLTFGEPYIFFFGEQPRVLTISGVLLNTEDFNWRAEWWENYDQYLRGTQCVKTKTRVYLSWDDIVVEGYITTAGASEQTTAPYHIEFQFQMFLTGYDNISNIGDGEAHLRGRNFSLNPDLADALGSDIRNLESSTIQVRRANVLANVGAGGGVSSLIQTLRDGALLAAFGSGTDLLVSLDGVTVNLLQLAAQYTSGRNIRVPAGFAGGAVFDDAQIALASIDVESITGVDRDVRINANLAGRAFTIEGSLGRRTMPAKYGPLFENTDEFLAISQPTSSFIQAPDLFKDQRGDREAIDKTVRDTFKKFGVDVDPPNEITTAALKGLFAVSTAVKATSVSAALGNQAIVAQLTNVP